MSRRNLPRAARPKPGKVVVKWGALGDDNPELIVTSGGNTPCGSRRMIYWLLSRKNYNCIDKCFEASPLELLEEWGFDIKTLRFEIEHKNVSEK